MKKILLATVMWFTLLTVGMSASEIVSSKEEMMRSASINSSDVVSLDPKPKSEERSIVAVILVAILVLILVGLVATFITKYTVTIREKNSNIYEQKSKENKIDDNKSKTE